MKRLDVIGYVGADPVQRVSAAGEKFVTFPMAVKISPKEEKGDWLEVSCSEKQGLYKVITEHVKKGIRLYCSGAPKTYAYLKKDGTPAKVERLYIKEFEFQSNKDDVSSVIKEAVNLEPPQHSEEVQSIEHESVE